MHATTEAALALGEADAVASSWAFCGDGVEQPRQLHASILDALEHAGGVFVHWVRWQRSELRPLINANQALHAFAAWCAESALRREASAGREPHALTRQALRSKARWLQGECDDAQLADAREALELLIRAAAHTRIRQSLRAVWHATARDRIWQAAAGAAQEAANVAAWDASWLSERRGQEVDLERRLLQIKRSRDDSSAGDSNLSASGTRASSNRWLPAPAVPLHACTWR